MYDSINMILSGESITNIDVLSEVPCNLYNSEQRDNGDYIYYTGHLKNLYIIVKSFRVTIRGSLAKYYYGNNFKILTRQDTQEAIEKLSKELKIPVHMAKVTQIHFGINIITEAKPNNYYSCLGDCKHFERIPYLNSLIYRNKNRQIVIYDKAQEAMDKKSQIPKEWKGLNVLRIEPRYFSRIDCLNNCNPVFGYHLYEENFYEGVRNRIIEHYKSIYKIKKFVPLYNGDGTVNEYLKYSLAARSNERGYITLIDEINMLDDNNFFKRDEYSSRVKKELKEICNKFSSATKRPLLEELNSKIYNFRV
ncbi:MAG: phage/plasmid replication protein [Balneola sp.]